MEAEHRRRRGGARRGCRTRVGLVLGAGMELQRERSAGGAWRRDREGWRPAEQRKEEPWPQREIGGRKKGFESPTSGTHIST